MNLTTTKAKITGILFFVCLAIGIIAQSYENPAPLTPGQPPVIVEVLDPRLEEFADVWKHEVERRFSNAVAVIVHGNDLVAGEWVTFNSTQPWKHLRSIKNVVRDYQQLYPSRTVVLICCNTGHLTLGVKGVYYAKSSVWCIPDRAMKPSSAEAHRKLNDFEDAVKLLVDVQKTRWELEPDVVGNIFEFVTD